MGKGIIAGYTPAQQDKQELTLVKPDMNLVGKLLANKQQDYDTKLAAMGQIKAKITQVSALDGYDAKRRKQIESNYDKEVERISGLYGGDLTKASAEFDGLMTRVGKDFGASGELASIERLC
jgi:hypothetical protein